jgi:hypothetical protein
MPKPIIPADVDTWRPLLPGTTKRTCNACGHSFASRGKNTCPNCIAKGREPAEEAWDKVGLKPPRKGNGR